VVGAFGLLVFASAPSGGILLLPGFVLAVVVARRRHGAGPPLFGLLFGAGLMATALAAVSAVSDDVAIDDALWQVGLICALIGARAHAFVVDLSVL
jgi:hypothetical protein